MRKGIQNITLFVAMTLMTGQLQGAGTDPLDQHKVIAGFYTSCMLGQEEALANLKNKATEGDFLAHGYLSVIYREGLSVQKDIHKAKQHALNCKDWLIKQSDGSNPYAQYVLGHMYSYGVGVERDLKKAIEFSKYAAGQGYVEAITNLGALYLVVRRLKEGIEQLEVAAKLECISALNMLGHCYRVGIGVEYNFRKSAEFYTRSANQGNRDGQYKLGIAYRDGKGVPRDAEKARSWLKKAAKQGHLEAIEQLEVERKAEEAAAREEAKREAAEGCARLKKVRSRLIAEVKAIEMQKEAERTQNIKRTSLWIYTLLLKRHALHPSMVREIKAIDSLLSAIKRIPGNEDIYSEAFERACDKEGMLIKTAAARAEAAEAEAQKAAKAKAAEQAAAAKRAAEEAATRKAEQERIAAKAEAKRKVAQEAEAAAVIHKQKVQLLAEQLYPLLLQQANRSQPLCEQQEESLRLHDPEGYKTTGREIEAAIDAYRRRCVDEFAEAKKIAQAKVHEQRAANKAAVIAEANKAAAEAEAAAKERAEAEAAIAAVEEAERAKQAEQARVAAEAAARAEAEREAAENKTRMYSAAKAEAAKGNPDAECYVGVCYANGMGVAEDLTQAVQWFNAAASKGNLDAQCYLGLCYAGGIGVSADPVQALKWFNYAAAGGHKHAKGYLEQFQAHVSARAATVEERAEQEAAAAEAAAKEQARKAAEAAAQAAAAKTPPVAAPAPAAVKAERAIIEPGTKLTSVSGNYEVEFLKGETAAIRTNCTEEVFFISLCELLGDGELSIGETLASRKAYMSPEFQDRQTLLDEVVVQTITQARQAIRHHIGSMPGK